jgi:hypothetical protein
MAYHFGDDAVHAALGGERQVAPVQNLGLAALVFLSGVNNNN